MMDTALLSSLFGTHELLTAILMAWLLFVATCRRDQIQKLGVFRTAYLLFAVSLVLNPILSNLSMNYLLGAGGSPFGLGGRGGGGEQLVPLTLLLRAIGPLLMATSFALAIGSIIPFSQVAPRPAPPTKHPLDD